MSRSDHESAHHRLIDPGAVRGSSRVSPAGRAANRGHGELPYQQVLGLGTTRRFLLLLLVMVTSCLYILNWMAWQQRSGEVYLACMRAVEARPHGADLENLLVLVRHADTVVACKSRLTAMGSLTAVAGTGTVLLVSLLACAALPWWLRRRRNPVRVPSDGELDQRLRDLTRRAGIANPPEFVVDPDEPTPSAFVFGRAGRNTVCLHQGLLDVRDSPHFEAVVLHELAHVRHRDVDITYATVLLWRAFALLVLTPYALQLVWLFWQSLGTPRPVWPGYELSVIDGLFPLMLVAQVRLARADVLRSRELWADAEAVARGADPAVWHALAEAEQRGTRSVRRWVRRPLLSHPTWSARSRLIKWRALARIEYRGSTGMEGLLFYSAVVVLMMALARANAPDIWSPLRSVVTYTSVAVAALTYRTALRTYQRPKILTPDSPPPRKWGAGTVAAVAVAVGVLSLAAPLPLGGYNSQPVERWPAPLRTADVPPVMRGRIAAWADGGGTRAMAELAEAHQSFVVKLARAEKRPAGAERRGSDIWIDRRGFTADCAAVRSALDRGRGYRPFPDQEGRRMWAKALEMSWRAHTFTCGLDDTSPIVSRQGLYDDAKNAYVEFCARYRYFLMASGSAGPGS